MQEEEQEFKIQGRAREKKVPPAGPTPIQVPTGPRALNIQQARGQVPNEPSQRRSSTSHVQPSPTADKDPYMQEREARRRERLLKDEERRKSLAQGKNTSSVAHSRKRSYDEANTNGEDCTCPGA